MKRFSATLLIVFIVASSVGCSSFGRKLKAWASGKDSKKSNNVQSQSLGGPTAPIGGVSYSNVPEYKPSQKRKYKRITKKTIENQARVDSKAGSLWVNEGQSSYLFTQNIVRMIGDTLVVNLEGEPKQQLETKAKVIQDLLKKLERRRSLASKKVKKDKGKDKKENADKQANNNKNGEAEDSPLKVKKVSTRIIERLIDGNYRIKGSQPFMIGKREYKVIVAGIIRSEDFNDDGVNSSKLVEPQFDIVSVRKGIQ